LTMVVIGPAFAGTTPRGYAARSANSGCLRR
jgi:hypothetical protein